MRSGIIAKKLGMTRLFMEDGKQIPVTVLQMENLQVVSQQRSIDVQLHDSHQVDSSEPDLRQGPVAHLYHVPSVEILFRHHSPFFAAFPRRRRPESSSPSSSWSGQMLRRVGLLA